MIRKILTSLLICFALSYGASAQSNYTDGIFVLNEGWFGHCNSTINYLDGNGKWVYDVIEKENPGIQLGSTTSTGTIYGDRFYIITKQDKDGGSDKEGARITICDAKTMKVIKQLKDIDNKGNRADGRGFVAVDNKKAYIGTNNGIYIFDLENYEIKGRIEGSENEHTDPYGKIYLGQTGTLLRINEKVYALHQDMGLMVIDPETDKITDVISGPDNGELTYGSAVLSKDGSMWMSVSDRYGRGDVYSYLIKYDTATGDTLRVNIPEGINPPSNSWFAWTPDGFCASTKNNVLYWSTGNLAWYSNNKICRYDIDKNEFSQFADFESEELKVYGSSMRVDPVTDNLYVTLFKDTSIPYFTMREYNNAGIKLNEYEMMQDYWFPSIQIFPDNENPVSSTPDAVNITDSKQFTVNLNNIATDADNMSAAMVKTITEITDNSVISAEIRNGNLNITPLKDGNSTVVLNINSNGKNTSADVAVSVTGYNGIDDASAEIRSAYVKDGMIYINNCNGTDFTVYDMSGNVIDNFKADEDRYVRYINVPSGVYIIKGTSEITFKLNIR